MSKCILHYMAINQFYITYGLGNQLVTMLSSRSYQIMRHASNLLTHLYFLPNIYNNRNLFTFCFVYSYL